MRILAVGYTQSGQMLEILNRFLIPFSEFEIEYYNLEPQNKFPFPWTAEVFFDTMPACVLETEIPLKPYTFKSVKYDLIVLAYQPWFLSPSLPVTALLKLPEFKRILHDTPVVTLIAGRNMWLNAQESVKQLIKLGGGRLIGNVPLMDRTANLISAVTILHWMLTGKKERKWGFFPKPGVSDDDIASASVFGEIVKKGLVTQQYGAIQNDIMGTGRIYIPTDILFIEERAKKIFRIWAGLITKKGTTPAKRKRLVHFFKYYLLVALFIVAPVLVTVYKLLFAPLLGSKIKRKKEYFCGLELQQ